MSAQLDEQCIFKLENSVFIIEMEFESGESKPNLFINFQKIMQHHLFEIGIS